MKNKKTKMEIVSDVMTQTLKENGGKMELNDLYSSIYRRTGLSVRSIDCYMQQIEKIGRIKKDRVFIVTLTNTNEVNKDESQHQPTETAGN